jgi:hypothetical protein
LRSHRDRVNPRKNDCNSSLRTGGSSVAGATEAVGERC